MRHGSCQRLHQTQDLYPPRGTTETLVLSPANILQESLSTQPNGCHLSCHSLRPVHLCFLSQLCNSFVTMSVISN